MGDPWPHPPTARQAPVRLDCLAGAPSCDRCGYNLHAQRVLRESATDIAVVRCPECGSVRPVSCLHHQAELWRWWAQGNWLLRVLSHVAALGLYALATYRVYDHSPGYPASGPGLLGYVGIGVGWAAASLPQVATLLLAAGHMGRSSASMRLIALLAPVAAAYTGYRHWTSALGGPGTANESAVLVVAVCHAAVATALALYGRPILRAVIRAACPPGARLAFEPLWQADGLCLPVNAS